MRNLLTGELRAAFDVAWSTLPSSVAQRLRPYLISVRSARNISEVRVRTDQGPCGPELDGSAWCGTVPLRGIQRAFLVFSEMELGGSPRPFIVATMVHELAHANAYYEDAVRAADADDGLEEWATWLQAAVWLAQGKATDAHEAIKCCLRCAETESATPRSSEA